MYSWLNLKRYFGSPKDSEPLIDIGNGTYATPNELREIFRESEQIARRALARMGESYHR